jgi:hypothetical protein
VEALEPRTLLAIAANNDIYGATEDTSPNTAPVTLIPQYAGLWYVNDELLWSVNQYPTDAAGRHWADRDYEIGTSRIGANPSIWDGPIPGPFVYGSLNAFAGVPQTLVDVPASTETTFLLRRILTLDAVVAEAVWGRITYTCDSGCIMYVNGVRAASSPNMAGISSPTPNTFAGNSGDEDLPHATVSFSLNGAGQPPLYEGSNVLAVEVHNDSLASGDIGGDFSLAIAPQGGSVLTNDNFASQSGAIVLAKLSDPVDEATGDPAGTITLNTDALSPDFGIFSYTPATNYCGTASWAYQIEDAGRTPSTGTVRLNVACVNDPPAARDDFYAVKIGAVLDIRAATGLLANDTDAEGDTLMVETVDTSAVTAQGTLNVSADGTFTFDPYPTAIPGAYSFTYRVVDSGTPIATSNLATAEITITPGCDEGSDLDQNGQVGGGDLAILVAHFGSRTAMPGQGDINCDGKVGLADLAALKRQWMLSSPSASAASVLRSTGFRPANETRRLSATRFSDLAELATAVDCCRPAIGTDPVDAALSERDPATRLRAGRRTANQQRYATESVFSDWDPM